MESAATDAAALGVAKYHNRIRYEPLVIASATPLLPQSHLLFLLFLLLLFHLNQRVFLGHRNRPLWYLLRLASVGS